MKRKNIKILVLDDDNNFRVVMTEAVKRAGYTVFDYASPDDALNHVKIKAVDFAIIDCMLPKKNGIAVASEMRMLGLDDLPICFVSGIFKDKSFIQDALKKTNAVKFLTKPFKIDELLTTIEEQVKVKAIAPAVSKAVILTTKNASIREKSKFLDRAMDLTGKDIPLLIKLFLLSNITGSLNFISEEHGIFGVKIVNGGVDNVESEAAIKIYKKILTEKQLVDESDFELIDKELNKGDVLKNLVNYSLISPHLYKELKIEYINIMLKEIVKFGSLQAGFSRSENSEDEAAFCESDFQQFILDCMVSGLDDQWFISFFEDVDECVLQLKSKTLPKNLASISELEDIDWASIVNKPMEDIFRSSSSSLPLKKALYILCMFDFAFIEKPELIVSSNTEMNRLQSLHEVLSTKNPIEIFRYFGASNTVPNAEVEKIYRDLAKTYHPDLLADRASPEHKELVHEVFSTVTNAHNILTNPEQRQEFEQKLEQKDAEKQIKSDAILEDGIKELKRGRISEAIILLEISNELFINLRSKLYIAWAKIKQSVDDEIDEVTFDNIKHLLSSTPSEDRKTAVYQHVSGLFAKSRGDAVVAQASFEKALSIDGGFIDSRRELASLSKESKVSETTSISEILTGDLSAVFSNLFKKKSS